MAFQIKDFISVVAGMVSHMRGATGRITDYNVGSVARTLVEAPAVELEELYLQMVNGLTESIPVAVYQAFQFDRLPATYAGGRVRLTVNTPATANVTVPAGTVFTAPGTGQQYVTTSDALLAIGQTAVEVPVRAMVAGIAGNALADTITGLPQGLSGIDAVVNPYAIGSGREAESEVERRVRFGAYIASLSRGTLAAIEYAVRSAYITDAGGAMVEQVVSVGIEERLPGLVQVWVHNGVGGTSAALVARAQAIVDGYVEPQTGQRVPGFRAGGVQVSVAAVSERAIPLDATVIVLPGYALDTALTQALQAAFGAYLASLAPGEVMYLSRLIAALLSVPGVNSIDLATPAGNVHPSSHEVLVPGEVRFQ